MMKRRKGNTEEEAVAELAEVKGPLTSAQIFDFVEAFRKWARSDLSQSLQ